MEQERVIATHDAHADPRTREFSQGYLTPLGIGSMLDASIRSGGKTVGEVCHEHVGRPRRWWAEEEQFAGSIADMVSLVLESFERKRVEESQRFLAEASAALSASSGKQA